jgi:hypothetical protein
MATWETIIASRTRHRNLWVGNLSPLKLNAAADTALAL